MSSTKVISVIIGSALLVAAWGVEISVSPKRELATTRLEYCGLALQGMARGALKAAKAPYHGLKWVVDAPARKAEKENTEALHYQAVSRRPISSYFARTKSPKPEEIKKFLEDFNYVASNFARFHLVPHTDLQSKSHLEAKWEIAGPELLKEHSFLAKNASKTVESLLLERHFDASRTDAAIRDAKIRNLKYYAWRSALLPYYAVVKLGGTLIGESKWTARLILATILGTAFSNIHEPITANLSTFVNQHLGWVAVSLQMGITRVFADLERAREVHSQMQEVQLQMEDANQKYRIQELSKDQAIKLWEKLDETFLNYSKEMRSVIPDNIASGRAYYKDGNFTNPIAFITAAATINVEKMQHESVVRTLSLKAELTKKPLSDVEKAELEFHQAQVATSKKRLGTVIAMWRVYEIIYPELTRAAFMKAGMNGDQIRTSYDVYRQGLDFDAYAQEYAEQMKQALMLLGMEIQQLDSARQAAEQGEPHLPVDLSLK